VISGANVIGGVGISARPINVLISATCPVASTVIFGRAPVLLTRRVSSGIDKILSKSYFLGRRQLSLFDHHVGGPSRKPRFSLAVWTACRHASQVNRT
jgi:hypothetical protein